MLYQLGLNVTSTLLLGPRKPCTVSQKKLGLISLLNHQLSKYGFSWDDLGAFPDSLSKPTMLVEIKELCWKALYVSEQPGLLLCHMETTGYMFIICTLFQKVGNFKL